MRYLIPSKATRIFYDFIVAIFFLCLKNCLITCLDEIVYENWGLRNEYPAICDHQYRKNYFIDKKHRNAVKAALLYVPPPMIRHEDLNHPHNFTFEDPFGGLFPRFQKNINRSWLTRKFSDKTYDSKISNDIFLLARKNYSDRLKALKIAELRRRIIFKNKYYQKKGNVNIRRRKKPRNGSKFLHRNTNSLFNRKSNIFRTIDDNRRDWDYGEYDWNGWEDWGNGEEVGAGISDDLDEKLCKSVRKIVGGETVVSAEVLPYMAFVDSGCGGGIISEKFVITAGHCVDGQQEPRYVHVGSTRLLSGCQYNVAGIWIHPKYGRQELVNDLALLKVNPPFVWSPAIKPIKLSSKKAEEKTCGIVAGWGATAFTGQMMLNLGMATLPVIQRNKCKGYNMLESQFCGGYEDSSINTCPGDGGGPFVVQNYLVGIIAYGYKCASPSYTGVYEDISFHRRWIRKITGI